MEFPKRRSDWKAMAIVAAIAVPIIGGVGAIYKYWPELASLAERLTKKDPTCSYGSITIEAGAILNLICVAHETSTNQTVVADRSMNRIPPEQAPKGQSPTEPNVAKQEQPAAETPMVERNYVSLEAPKYPTLFDNIREQFARAPILSSRVLFLDQSKPAARPTLTPQHKQVTRVAVRFVRVLTYEQGDSDELVPALIRVPCTNTFMPDVCFMPAKNRKNIVLRIP